MDSGVDAAIHYGPGYVRAGVGMRALFVLVLGLAGCDDHGPSLRVPPAGHPADTAGDTDVATNPDTDVPVDTAPVDPDACFVSSWGVDGKCMLVSECAALEQTSVAGYCPGPADVQCCTATPDTADNPPVPDGWHLMTQGGVTSEMTDWAVEILHDGTAYPMYSTTTRWFGDLDVLARVEWHPPDFNNGAIHRGVTLYVPDATG
jgi:hypothetical protein